MKKILELLGAIAIAVFGTFLIIDASKVTNLLSIIVGILIGLEGIYEIVTYFKTKQTSILISGLINILVGIIITCNASLFKNVFSIVIGIIIIVSSIEKWHICNKNIKEKSGKVIAYKITLAISIIMGLVCVLGKFIIPDLVVRLIGLLLWIYGIIECLNVFIIGTEHDIENIA